MDLVIRCRLQSALLASIVLVAVSFAQDRPTFTAGVSLVRIDAEVTDGSRIVTGLSRSDFVITDNGAPQEILYFSEAEEPLDLVLLFDISGSMRPSVEKVAQSMRIALAELRSGDRAAVMVFNSRSRLLAPFTDDLGAVERTLNEDVLGRKFGGGTRILAAVDNAASLFAKSSRERRRAILIFTDNFGQRSRKTSTVVNHLWEADAVLNGLIIRSARMETLRKVSRIIAPQSIITDKLLQEGIEGASEKTGGDIVKVDNPDPAFRDMMQRIRRRYLLYYAQPAGVPGELRQIRVELTADARTRYAGVRVRARKGYHLPER